ncbi:phosphatidylinositol synthase [Mycena maculata]|uniref:CDP-diacylglycerol--inositol 3-phosphatidyltransferase n=1 Tax=Mycena maculata TaxID=230809 RepID=A0AAD7IDL7_9AGAR|nr:phosphatidylinositol synthase [Mycena maculata]
MTSRRRNNAAVDVGAEEALDLATAQSENVFLFIPNLIGYTRIILAAVSLHFMSYHPIYCTVAYCVSCLLDAVDGQAARFLNQTSKFGAVLDMVTDRCTTSCLLCYLSSAYPVYATFFQFLIALDFSSHYMHMYSSLVTGQRSHKLVKGEVSRILWWYYNDPLTLFVVCAGNELFFVSLYLMKWTVKPFSLLEDIPWIGGITYAQTFALLSFPIFFIKNFINVVQLWKASKILVGVDIKERQEARKAKA